MRLMKVLSFLFSLAIGLILFFWILSRIGLAEIWGTLLTFSLVEALIILSLGALNFLVVAWRLKEILRDRDCPVSLRELVVPTVVRFSVAYLMPMMVLADELVKIFLLHKKTRVALDKSAAAVLIEVILDLVGMALVITIGLVLFFLRIGILGEKERVLITGGTPDILSILLTITGGTPDILSILLTIGALLIAGLGLIFFYRRLLGKKSLVKLFFNFSEDNYGRRVEKEVLAFLKAKNRGFQKAAVISGLKFSLIGLQYWLLLFFLGKSLSFFSLLLVLGLSLAGMSIPISADLGSHEVIMVSAFRSLALEPGVAVAFTSILRVTHLIFALLGMVILFKLGMNFSSFLFQHLNDLKNNHLNLFQHKNEESRNS